MDTLKAKYESDMQTWDECADTYERQIVGGHPDILAFEEFEEDLLDHLLRHLALTQNRKIKLMDIGCGSGRLHVRYGSKTQNIFNLNQSHPLVELKKKSHNLAYDPLLAEGLSEVWGIDFSQKMIHLAKDKLRMAGLNEDHAIALSFDQGSAFELEAQPDDTLPVAICLVNSIGVMQGFEGANALFKSMRHAVEAAQGIAIVSCYQQEYIETYALGQYESTMDVSGQPIWIGPDTYASNDYVQIPKQYKRSHSMDDTLHVDVYDKSERLIRKGHVLKRIPSLTRQTIDTGDINTYSSYKSHWYSYKHIQEFIDTHWDAKKSYHIKTQDLDMIRAEPAQIAILDFGNNLNDIFKRWKVVK